MPWHWQTVFRFHRHQKDNKDLAFIKFPIFPSCWLQLPRPRTHSAAAALSHQHTARVLRQHNYLHGWTANWFSWKPTWKQNSAPICNLVQSSMKSCAGTRGKTVRGWEYTALGMAWPSWHHFPQGHGEWPECYCSTQEGEHFDLSKWGGPCDKASLPSIQTSIKRMVHVSEVKHEHSHT